MTDRRDIITRAIAHLESGKSTALNPEGSLSVLRKSQQGDGGGIRPFAAFKLAQRVLVKDGEPAN